MGIDNNMHIYIHDNEYICKHENVYVYTYTHVRELSLAQDLLLSSTRPLAALEVKIGRAHV